ncbi:p33 [Matsumuraeses phaseoli granulovirus]|uniref:P33 n=1 Tax=Matsumuraeses phaseoli granulovirus TaxID=2760664 RepID=A0AAE7SYS0_9BBAC|nr:p33 [Matsumuraeses phaseoli granulovirus]QOD40047.1 p33 [Matsumuraeses phaseoli granulovirus]
MLVETPTVLRYKKSFALFLYRLLDMTRMAPSLELKQVISNEVKFLYNLMCVIVYKENRDNYINDLVLWASNLGSDIKIEIFKDMYTEKLLQINLNELSPAKYVFSFATIWDSIHLMCMLGDDIVLNRDKYDLNMVIGCIKNFKWVFYNVFIVLFCPICAKHYLTIDNFPYEFEKVETALYREKMGEPIIMVEEIQRNQIHKNILLKNNLLYKSMVFHNHVNNYRPIQHNKDDLNNFQRMEWSIYKSLLGIA